MRLSALLCLILISLNGCAALIVGGVAGTGYVATQERSVGKTIDDTQIWTNIKGIYYRSTSRLDLAKVSVDVNEGRVLLTGRVKTPEMRIEASRLAWQAAGVTQVTNEVKTEGGTIGDFVNDNWITSQVRSKLLFSKNTKSSPYSIDTVNGTVYLSGISETAEEREEVNYLASTVRGVREVISHITLRQDQRSNY